MKVKPLGRNQTEIVIGNRRVLFSYETPVALQNTYGSYRTEKKWSATTTRHINTWLKGKRALPMKQCFFDNLA